MPDDSQWEATHASAFPEHLREAIVRGAEAAFAELEADVDDLEKGDVLAEALQRVHDSGEVADPEQFEQVLKTSIERVMAERGTLPQDVRSLIEQWAGANDPGVVIRQAERYAEHVVPSVRAFAALDVTITGVRITSEAIEYRFAAPAEAVAGQTDVVWRWYDLRDAGESTLVDFESELTIETDRGPLVLFACITDSQLIHLDSTPFHNSAIEHRDPDTSAVDRATETTVRATFSEWVSAVLADLATLPAPPYSRE